MMTLHQILPDVQLYTLVTIFGQYRGMLFIENTSREDLAPVVPAVFDCTRLVASAGPSGVGRRHLRLSVSRGVTTSSSVWKRLSTLFPRCLIDHLELVAKSVEWIHWNNAIKALIPLLLCLSLLFSHSANLVCFSIVIPLHNKLRLVIRHGEYGSGRKLHY